MERVPHGRRTVRTPIARVDDVPVGGVVGVVANGIHICLARTSERIVYAINDNCAHEDCTLSEGVLEDFAVECPCHGSRFDVRTGAVLNLPAVLPVETYPVMVVGDLVVVAVDE